MSPEQSALKRDLMLSDLEIVDSPDAAALWAHRVMAAKNSLTAADAARVEAAFHTKVSRLQKANEDAAAPCAAQLSGHGDTAEPEVRPTQAAAASTTDPANGIDKSALAFPEPRRVRDKDHLRFVASQPCLICGRKPSDPHHLRVAQARALGRKASDEFAVPLCRGHHRELHRYGDEAEWWSRSGIDPLPAARRLWLKSHPLPGLTDTTVPASVRRSVASTVQIHRADGSRSRVPRRPPTAMRGSGETNPNSAIPKP